MIFLELAFYTLHTVNGNPCYNLGNFLMKIHSITYSRGHSRNSEDYKRLIWWPTNSESSSFWLRGCLDLEAQGCCKFLMSATLLWKLLFFILKFIVQGVTCIFLTVTSISSYFFPTALDFFYSSNRWTDIPDSEKKLSELLLPISARKNLDVRIMCSVWLTVSSHIWTQITRTS